MCLAIPVKVITLLDNGRAIVNLGGVKKEISLALLDDIKADDYVVVHVGYAIARLDELEAQKTLNIFSTIAKEIWRVMKYISDFRNGELAKVLAKTIAQEVDQVRLYKFMEFCGGHTHTIHRYGIPSLLPKNVVMIHGPGCPVCVLPIAH